MSDKININVNNGTFVFAGEPDLWDAMAIKRDAYIEEMHK